MARPSKNNAEYFSHDADMRNNRKVKALRRRFSHKGYAVWCFILETLTDADYFEIKFDEVTQDLLAADFDITNEELQSIVAYCVKIRLLQMKDDTLYCEALKQRFSELLEKRRYNRERLETLRKKHKNAVTTTDNNDNCCDNNSTKTGDNDNCCDNNSTVKYSIENNSKEESKEKYIIYKELVDDGARVRVREIGKDDFINEYFDKRPITIDAFCKDRGITIERLKEMTEKILENWEIDGVTHIGRSDAFSHLRYLVETSLSKERTPAEVEETATKKRRTAKKTEAKPKREMNYDDTDFGSIDK